MFTVLRPGKNDQYKLVIIVQCRKVLIHSVWNSLLRRPAVCRRAERSFKMYINHTFILILYIPCVCVMPSTSTRFITWFR